ncbi:MAG: hypothetical protein WAP35_06905 [Solirubrobacterales bacterium]
MTDQPTKTLTGVVPAGQRGDDADRSFQWYTPAKRRATLYEDVTVDTQPSIHRHVTRGWPVCFEDGRGTWSDESTRLQSTDWFAFRDPGQLWERPYFQDGTGFERQIENSLRAGQGARLLDDFAPEWVEFLRTNLQITSFVAHGLWLATATIARDCLSDGLAHCVALEAAMKQRQSQAPVLFAMDIEETFGEFDITLSKSSFLDDEPWQPVRRLVERCRATHDWGEVIFAVNVCFEPLIGRLLNRELLMRQAPPSHDSLTPTLCTGIELEWDWIRSWTKDMMKFLVDDEKFGDVNRGILEEWRSSWLPETRAAAKALSAVFALLPNEVDFEAAYDACLSEQEALLETCRAVSVEAAQ